MQAVFSKNAIFGTLQYFQSRVLLNNYKLNLVKSNETREKTG